MSFVILIFFALIAGNSATPDPTKYCIKHQFMVTQVGIEATIEGGNAVGGKHRIFSAQDYVNKRFYTNYSLTLVDTSDQELSTVGYELLIDIQQNANYEIRNGKCKKYEIPAGLTSHLTQCLTDKMTYQGSSYVGAYKSSDKALRFDTFTMNLEMADDVGISGVKGQLSKTFIENPDNAGTYLQVKEDMIGSVNVPSLTSNTISYLFSSDFVDYQEEVDEARFRVPDYCPTEYSVDDGDFSSRSRRALSSKHFRLARYAAVLFAYEL